MPKSTTLCLQPGLEPGPLDSETRALSKRPPHTIQTSNFIEHMFFHRVMAEITSLDDKEPGSEEGVDEPIRYVFLNSL